MKEFEKYWCSDGDKIPFEEEGCPVWADYLQHKATWKAALRWLKAQNDVYIDKYICEYINKELEDK